MDKSKMLTGNQLVAKGVTKLDASLPEVGMKDVSPNGSWLEQKQIQSALEARKHLVEVERIEKRGILSHASWCDELKLAEVTQQVGGYWQYLGHNVGKKLYLRPEEALFLMETNCLLLKHNEVVVSLQKAYSLLLGEPICIKQYKVYASLSRIGYKVFRHRKIDFKESSNSQNKEESSFDKSKKINEVNQVKGTTTNNHNTEKNDSSMTDLSETEKIDTIDLRDTSIISRDTVDYDSMQQTAMNNSMEVSINLDIQDENTQENNNTGTGIKETEILNIDINDNQGISDNLKITEVAHKAEYSLSSKKKSAANIEESLSTSKLRLQELEKRQLKPCSYESLHKYFDIIPDLFKKTVVTINVPDEQYIPRNVFVNNIKYDLNLNVITSKTARCSSNETTYSTTDEVNAPHIRRLHSSSRNETPQNNYNTTFRQQNFVPFRPFNFWRPQENHNNLPFNMFFQRFPNNIFVPPQFNFVHNPFFLRPFHNSGIGNFIPSRPSISRSQYIQNNASGANLRHLQSIKSLAIRTRQLAASGRMQQVHIQGLRRLIDLYNATYNFQLRLTDTFDVIEDANIVETIELDVEDEPKRKKSRPNSNKFDENLSGIKDLALKLKIYEMNHGPRPKYRRALSNVIKKFNKSYNAEICLNKQFEIIDKKHISLESSSDSDCIVTEIDKSFKRKKLRNPFSIIKKHAAVYNTVSNQNIPVSKNDTKPGTSENHGSGRVENRFDKNWLPSEDDFGRSEVVPKCLMNSRLIAAIRDKYLYEFIKNLMIFENWLEIKKAYLKYLEESDQVFKDQQELMNECNSSSTSGICLKPLLRPEDCSDMGKVLERLRIISTNKDTAEEIKFKIDFDVYTRDVKTFRKSNPPKPHFRIICVDDSGSFPAALDVATLNLKYDDNIPILFAVVGTATVSYVQVNCIDLPIYLPKSDLT